MPKTPPHLVHSGLETFAPDAEGVSRRVFVSRWCPECETAEFLNRAGWHPCDCGQSRWLEHEVL